ncbi:MAG: NAD(P)H-dependent oxidoreductase subunit E, partial [candidate division Zixibacteria bacterium]|nr:NAD(P)H-dependent oxidoreductase subunit E [candidate division Zixibacteria bacterium]
MMLNEESVKIIKEKAAKYPSKKSAILPALTVAYKQLGYVDDELYIELSKVIDVPALEIAEAATFYTMFPKKPTGKYLLQVCH